MKKYKTKISYILLIVILSICLAPLIYDLILNGINDGLLTESVIVLIPTLFILHLFLKTEYTIKQTTINIKCSFVVNEKIDINTIKEVTKTNSILSSPAPSFDRIKIKYGKYSEIIISPKDKETFVKDLIQINPNIKNDIMCSI